MGPGRTARLNRGTGGNDRELLYWLPFTPEHGDEQVLLSPLRAAWQPDNTPLIDLIRPSRRRATPTRTSACSTWPRPGPGGNWSISGVLDPGRDTIRPAGGSLLEILWPHAGSDFIESLAAIDRRPTTAAGRPPSGPCPTRPSGACRTTGSRRSGRGWAGRRKLPPHEREVEIEFNWAGAQARRTGSVLHALLERVGNIGIENLEAQQQRELSARIPQLLRALGTGPEALKRTAVEISQAFERTLASETGRWILSGEHEDAACELALSGMVDGRLVNAVIDRTFIDADGTRWIIDYKSGHHEGGDLEGFPRRRSRALRNVPASKLSRWTWSIGLPGTHGCALARAVILRP